MHYVAGFINKSCHEFSSYLLYKVTETLCWNKFEMQPLILDNAFLPILLEFSEQALESKTHKCIPHRCMLQHPTWRKTIQVDHKAC